MFTCFNLCISFLFKMYKFTLYFKNILFSICVFILKKNSLLLTLLFATQNYHHWQPNPHLHLTCRTPDHYFIPYHRKQLTNLNSTTQTILQPQSTSTPYPLLYPNLKSTCTFNSSSQSPATDLTHQLLLLETTSA